MKEKTGVTTLLSGSKAIWLSALIVAAVAWTYTAQCPCGPVPGLWLSGTLADEPVDNWAAANDVPLCQIQLNSWKPHSINLNCMSDGGKLYVSCSDCASKSWSELALREPKGLVRLNDIVYAVVFRRVTEADQLQTVWAARTNKLGLDSNLPLPAGWWGFELSSPSGG